MVDIKAALKKARSAGQTASPRGRAIVEISAFDEKANTATGKILDGLGAGEAITFKLSGKLGVDDYTKKKATKVILADGDKPGGTLQVEGLQKVDGSDVYKTRWVKTFRSKPEDDQNMHLRETFTLRVRQRGQGSEAKRFANLDILDMASEQHVTDVASLRTALTESINKKGAVTLMTVTPEGEPIIQPYYARRVKQEDGSYLRESGEDWLAGFEERLSAGAQTSLDEVFTPALEGKGVSIVPTTSLMLGSGTWDAVEENVSEGKRGGPVDPESFKVAPLAGRFAGAYNRLDIEADRKAVMGAFLAEANEDATAKFHEGGFGAVEDRDIMSFIEKRGIAVTNVAEQNGFVSGSILTLPYNKEKPENGEMVTKTFNVTAPAPFPPVKAFEDVRQGYYAEMVDAVKAIAEMELSGASKTAETKPAAAAAEKEADTTAAAIADAAPVEDDDIDDLLNEIGDDGIAP